MLLEEYSALSLPDQFSAKVAAVLTDLWLPAWMQADLMAAVQDIVLRAFNQFYSDPSRLIRVWLASDALEWAHRYVEAGRTQPGQKKNSPPELPGSSLEQRGWGNFVVEKELHTGAGAHRQSTKLVEIYLYLE
jgi:hypothetical protein